MKWLLTALVAVFLPLGHGYVADKPYPTFGQCDQNIISLIKGYWLLNPMLGKPRNVLQGIESKGNFTILHTSYDYLNSDNKCIYMNYSKGVMEFNFVPKTGSELTKTSWLVAEGNDGIIRGKSALNDAPEHRWSWYSVYFQNGVISCYICSENEGSSEPPLLDIMVETGSKSTAAKSAITSIYNLMQRWGVKLKYDYQQECF